MKTSTYTTKTPSGTEIVLARGSSRWRNTATLVANGKTISGTAGAPVLLAVPRDGATYWMAVGEYRIGLDYVEASAVTRWFEEAPERTEEAPERTAADRDYDEVRKADAAVEDAESASYSSPARICRARIAAESALAAWREAHPKAAAEADRKADLEKAADLRRLADDAEHYSADGWLDADERQLRADDLRGRARILDGTLAGHG